MGNTKHTPGPWIVDREDEFDNCLMIIDDSEEGVFVAKLSKHWHNYKANAQLVAAAPQLLEALQAIIAEYEDNSVQLHTPIAYFKPFRKAEEAIAKATGKEVSDESK